jgi:hypothetical protein
MLTLRGAVIVELGAEMGVAGEKVGVVEKVGVTEKNDTVESESEFGVLSTASLELYGEASSRTSLGMLLGMLLGISMGIPLMAKLLGLEGEFV